jgi:hypothetical protein
MHCDVYSDDGVSIFCSLLCNHTYFQGNQFDRKRLGLRNWRHVLVLWLGLHRLAGFRSAVRKASCLSYIYGWLYYDLCTTNGPYLATKILQGFFGAPVESLCEISMTDIWFAHERPLFLAIYGLSLAFSGKFSPVFAAFINTGQGWKWTLVSTNLFQLKLIS